METLAGVEAIYFGGYHPEAGLILKQMSEQGLNAKMYSADGMNTAELWAIAGPAATNLFFTFAPDPLYAAHLVTTAPFGLSPQEDQQIAGLIMWVPAMIPYFLIGALIARRAWRRDLSPA